jgi:hypothetical protein
LGGNLLLILPLQVQENKLSEENREGVRLEVEQTLSLRAVEHRAAGLRPEDLAGVHVLAERSQERLGQDVGHLGELRLAWRLVLGEGRTLAAEVREVPRVEVPGGRPDESGAGPRVQVVVADVVEAGLAGGH